MNKLLIFVSALLLSLAISARKPAVEAIRGIAIDKYNDSNLKTARPYNFNQNKTSRLPSNVPSHSKKSFDVPTKTLSLESAPETHFIQYLVIAMLIILPFALWFGLLKGLKTSDDGEAQIASSQQENLDISRDNDDDDINIPKAS